MDAVKITLNKKNFVLRFGMKFFKLLGEKIGTPTLMLTQQKVLEVLNGMETDITFDQIDIISAMISAAIEADSANTENVSADDVADLFLTDTIHFLEVVKLVMAAFVESLPKLDKAQDQGKPKAPAKKNQTKPSQKK